MCFEDIIVVRTIFYQDGGLQTCPKVLLRALSSRMSQSEKLAWQTSCLTQMIIFLKEFSLFLFF